MAKKRLVVRDCLNNADHLVNIISKFRLDPWKNIYALKGILLYTYFFETVPHRTKNAFSCLGFFVSLKVSKFTQWARFDYWNSFWESFLLCSVEFAERLIKNSPDKKQKTLPQTRVNFSKSDAIIFGSDFDLKTLKTF